MERKFRRLVPNWRFLINGSVDTHNPWSSISYDALFYKHERMEWISDFRNDRTYSVWISPGGLTVTGTVFPGDLGRHEWRFCHDDVVFMSNWIRSTLEVLNKIKLAIKFYQATSATLCKIWGISYYYYVICRLCCILSSVLRSSLEYSEYVS